MNLRRQLLLVSLLTLVLPWAGCQFIRETESALRNGQAQMLAGTAKAIADSLSQFPEEMRASGDDFFDASQLYAHTLTQTPTIDGYFDDWPLAAAALRPLPATGSDIQFVLGRSRQHLFLYVDVRDNSPTYTAAQRSATNRDQVVLWNASDAEPQSRIAFIAEAPGPVPAHVVTASDVIDSRITAYWQDTAGGYRLEARIPMTLVGARLGIEVVNGDGAVKTSRKTFAGNLPGRLIYASTLLDSVARNYAQPGMRVTITNRAGWRLADTGEITADESGLTREASTSGWQQLMYRALLEQGTPLLLADADPSGRERQAFVARALNGELSSNWFRNAETGRAVVAVAYPIWSGPVQTGALILQQDTAAILSLTNASLVRLITLTIVATVVAALALLGYASWLSYRIRRLSNAAEMALDTAIPSNGLPSATAGDEIGDLSRSFSSVLEQLAGYNEYLRTLASKLSHELRTPLTIVTSSLENLDQEPLSESSREYTKRASDGAKRLRNILNAMSEANRVEQLIESADVEIFDLAKVVTATTDAYRDVWPERHFLLVIDASDCKVHGSPELIIQMLDKLVDNAVDFSPAESTVSIRLDGDSEQLLLSVSNAGPPLPAAMRHRLFESMVSVRENATGENLGLGLNIAKLIADGHGGSIHGENIEGGVRFVVRLPLTP